ncbi:hypothetical protein BA190_09450 [Labrys sp. WJW]|uniref:hypothetical protein n=1 Tax=Labrys sp. WJW TaxID=1737983 RepID=UPI00082F18E4|nr:hypothetical protein [Labrys sp. WJW]OCC05131.1 hypothetical protein BA190_09450 [Labrys sp. WJW]
MAITDERLAAIRAALGMPALSRRRVEAMVKAVEETAWQRLDDSTMDRLTDAAGNGGDYSFIVAGKASAVPASGYWISGAHLWNGEWRTVVTMDSLPFEPLYYRVMAGPKPA